MAKNKDIDNLLNALGNEDQEAIEAQMQALQQVAPKQFATGFADRVMQQIETVSSDANAEHGMDYFVPKFFRWVALTGIAAAISLLLMTYLSEDSLSVDALAGVSQLSVSDVFALNE